MMYVFITSQCALRFPWFEINFILESHFLTIQLAIPGVMAVSVKD